MLTEISILRWTTSYNGQQFTVQHASVMPFLLFSIIYNLKLYCNNHWLEYGFHHRKSDSKIGIHSVAVHFFQQKLRRGGKEDGNWQGLGGGLVLVEVVLPSSNLSPVLVD